MSPIELGADVTIATAVHGNAAVTRMCLESILRSAAGEFELLLIDDCSPDPAEIQSIFQVACKLHARTRIFRFLHNIEYTGSVNAILSHAAGRWVFFISNDILVTPFYLAGLLTEAQSNPNIGILRGSSNFVDNGLATHNLPMGKPITGFEELCEAGAECAARFGREIIEDPFLVGDAFLVSRAVIDRIGAFDPWFYGYFGDPEFGLRAQISGFRLALVPGAFAYHSRAANFDYLPDAERQAKLDRRWMRVYENWARFKIKYGMPVSLVYPGIAAIPWKSLAAAPFDPARHFAAPGNYLENLVLPANP